MNARAVALIGSLAILALPATAEAGSARTPDHLSAAARVKPGMIDVGSAEHEVRGGTDCLGQAASAQPHAPITIGSDADFTSVSSGVRSGSGTAEDPYVISGWLFTGQGDVVLDGVGHAIRIEGTTKHVILRNNVVAGTGYPQGLDVGIHVSAPNITIEGNAICSTVWDGIFANHTPGVVIRDNEIADARAGIWALDAPGAQVVSNEVELSLFGIAVEDSADSVIERNKVQTLGDPDLSTVGIVSNFCDAVRIADNSVTGPDATTNDHGINVFSSRGPVLTNNVVSGVGTFGFIVGYSSKGLIENNRGVANGLAGLLLWDDWAVGQNVIRGGDYSDNGSFGASLVAWIRSGVIVLDSDANVVEGVKATGNLYYGVAVHATDNWNTPGPDPTFDTVVRDVVATRNLYGFGVELSGDRGTLLTGARIAENGGGGLTVMDSTAVAEGNEVSDNDGTGVLVGGGVDEGGPIVRDNQITGNDRGVYLSLAHDAVLSGNVIDRNRYGFGIEGTTTEHFRNQVAASNSVDGRQIRIIEGATGELDAAALDAAYLALIRPADLVVRGLHVRRSVQGLVLFGAEGVRIEQPRLIDNQTGVDVMRSHDVTITGGTFEGNTTGARLWGDGTATTIAGSTFSDGERGVEITWMRDIPGVGFGTPSGTVISDNRFDGMRQVTIGMGGPETTISDNTIAGPTDVAVDVTTGPSAIEGNQITGPGDRGISILAFFTTIRDNVISGFERAISNWYGESTNVEENLIRGNGIGYFSTGGADNSRLLKNVIADNQRGVEVRGEVWNLVIDCNRISGNGEEGIRTYILTFQSQITNNVIEGNDTGVRLDSTLGSFTGNRIAGNEIGIAYDRLAGLPSYPATGNDIVGNTRFGAMTLLAGNDTLVGLGTAFDSVTGNWWGHPSGPDAETNPLGRGDRVSDQLNYRNWRTEPIGAGACAESLPA